MRTNLEEQDSFTAKYDCNKCKDTTYILVDDEGIPCSCKEVRRAKKILDESGINDEFSKKTFDNFDYSRNIQTIDSYTIARSYVKDFDKINSTTNNSLIFMGSVGGGKTHISLAIVNIVFEIVNHRYFNNSPIIITTEIGRDELIKIDESIGLEDFKSLVRYMGGSMIYVTVVTMKAMNRIVRIDFKGDYKSLAVTYNLSEVHVRRIVRNK